MSTIYIQGTDVLKLGIYDFELGKETAVSSYDRKYFLVGYFPTDSDTTMNGLYRDAHSKLLKRYPDLVGVEVSERFQLCFAHPSLPRIFGFSMISGVFSY